MKSRSRRANFQPRRCRGRMLFLGSRPGPGDAIAAGEAANCGPDPGRTWLRSRLEVALQPQLHLAMGVSSVDDAESRLAGLVSWIVEFRRVEAVERLETELHPHALADPRVVRQGDAKDMGSPRTERARDLAPSISKREPRRNLESRFVRPKHAPPTAASPRFG